MDRKYKEFSFDHDGCWWQDLYGEPPKKTFCEQCIFKTAKCEGVMECQKED